MLNMAVPKVFFDFMISDIRPPGIFSRPGTFFYTGFYHGIIFLRSFKHILLYNNTPGIFFNPARKRASERSKTNMLGIYGGQGGRTHQAVKQQIKKLSTCDACFLFSEELLERLCVPQRSCIKQKSQATVQRSSDATAMPHGTRLTCQYGGQAS